MYAREHVDEKTIDIEPQTSWTPALKMLSGKMAGSRVEIKGDSFTIGRAGGNSLVLDDQAVSRRHAVIERKDNCYIIHDLGSRWGLLVNGQKTGEAALKFGDEIEIAGIRLAFNLMPRDEFRAAKKATLRRIAIIVLLFAAIAAVATFIYFKKQSSQTLDRPGADIVSQVIYHYDRGIQYYNQIHLDKTNREKAIEEMEQVIELDH